MLMITINREIKFDYQTRYRPALSEEILEGGLRQISTR